MIFSIQEEKMIVKVIGLGKMGMGIAENLLRNGYTVRGFDTAKETRLKLEKMGGAYYESLQSLLTDEQQLVWIMLPAGKITNETIQKTVEYLNPGSIVIDAGNSHYTDSVYNAKFLAKKGIHFLDVGTSGGVNGAKQGACMMIGGEASIFKKVETLFKDICVEGGYLYCGKAGSGHYLKMVHNGIEYGMMQSIGEGFNLLNHSPYEYNLANVAQVFNHGSVIRSWLMELTENVYRSEIDFDKISGVIPSSGEGKWTVEEALRLKVSLPVITQSLMTRYASEDCDKIGEKVVALLRNQFGGHAFIEGE